MSPEAPMNEKNGGTWSTGARVELLGQSRAYCLLGMA
jgi:hypothetical protein